MGMPPYGMMPPTGYSMKADTWVNSSALLGRMNFALGLTAGKVRGVSVDSAQLAPGATDAEQALARLEDSLLGATSRGRRMIRSASNWRIRRSASGGWMIRTPAERRRDCGIDFGVAGVSEEIAVGHQPSVVSPNRSDLMAEG